MDSNLKEEFNKAIDEAYGLFLELQPTDQWKLEKDNDGLKIYTRKDETSGIKMARGETTINKPIAKVKEVVSDTTAVPKWDVTVAENELLEENGEFRIVRSVNQKQALVTQRETVMCIQTLEHDGGSLRIGRSIEHPKYEPRKDYVRAFIHIYAWLLIPDPADANKTKVVYMMFVDPKGWVPTALFNTFVEQQGTRAQKLKTYAESL